MPRHRIILPAALWLLCTAGALAATHYATVHNRFDQLKPTATVHCTTGCRGERFLADNASATPLLVAHTIAMPAGRFRVQARMANQHNDARSSYTVRTASGAKQRVHDPEWGIYVAPVNTGNAHTERWELVAQCGNSVPNDEITDERSMTLTLRHVAPGGHTTTLASQRLTKGVNLYNRLNTFQLELHDGTLTAWAGDDELQQLFAVPLAIGARSVQAGCLAGPGAKVEIERCVVSYDERTTPAPTRQWTVEALDSLLAQSTDPVEGYWAYQDRDLDDRHLRLGGRYTVAVVKQGDGYEIIYIDGAETRRSQWHTGMLKGRLTRTMFSDHYDLMWVDATGEPIARDAYATVENGVLLNLKFPVFNSQLRLHKVLHR